MASLKAPYARRKKDEDSPLGIILCAGKNTEQIELLELDQSGIHIAKYLTVLPPKEILNVARKSSFRVPKPRLTRVYEHQHQPEPFATRFYSAPARQSASVAGEHALYLSCVSPLSGIVS